MPATFDNADFDRVAAATTHTLSFTNAGDCLLVQVELDGQAVTISGVTYNGVAMTEEAAANPTNTRFKWYSLLSPATGPNDIVVTYSGSSGGARSLVAISYSGVASLRTQQNASAAGSAGPATLTYTNGQVGDTVVFMGGNRQSPTAATMTADAGLTPRVNDTVSTLRGAAAEIAGATSVLGEWTLNLSTNWGVFGIGLVPSAGVTADRLTITTQPANAVVGATMANIVVKATDAALAVDTSQTGNVTLAWGTNPSGAPAPAGTLTVAMVAGVATFTDIVVSTLQTAATFDFTSAGLTGATSSTFNIIAPSGSGGGNLFGGTLIQGDD